MKNNLQRGFTLIELLVVVAIIGILASVMLASLNSSRSKGADAAIKSNLANIRPQAELIYSSSGCYGDGNPVTDTSCTAFVLAQCSNATANVLFTNPIVWDQITAAANAGTGITNTRCYSSGQAWATAVQLETSDGPAPAPLPDSWCVDSLGASKSYSWATGQTISNSIGLNGCS
ncbi:MAG: type II secretion system protein [bacterium]|nr:type II secretion system protein [bacterium]